MAKTKKARVNTRIFRDKTFIVSAIVLLFGLVGFFAVHLSRAATVVPTAPSIYLSPTTDAYAINSTVTVQVRTNTGTTAVNGVQANFTYPTNLMTWVSTDYTSSGYSVQAENSVNTTTGQVRIARSTSGGTSVSGDQLVATLTFTTRTTGGTANLTFTTGTAVASASTNADILAGTSAWGNAAYTIDTTGPTVSVSAPGSTIQYGSTYTVTATASDAGSAVSRVEIYIDGTLRATDTATPYTYAWSTAGVAEGAHTFYAKAFDTFDNTTTSSTVNATVADTTAPTVSLTAPTAGATLAGTTTVTATASDNSGGRGMARVEFYIDGTLRSTDTTSPYSFSLDTTAYTDASHTFYARAYDSAATPNAANSTTITATIDNADKVAPSAPGSLRTTATTLTSVSLAWNQSTDNVGVTAYRLSRNGTVVYTGTALAYTDSGLANGTSYTYSVIALDGAGNASSATTLSASTVARKKGDVNADGVVNISDLSLLISKWNTNDSDSDINKDGVVNIFDLSTLVSNWS